MCGAGDHWLSKYFKCLHLYRCCKEQPHVSMLSLALTSSPPLEREPRIPTHPSLMLSASLVICLTAYVSVSNKGLSWHLPHGLFIFDLKAWLWDWVSFCQEVILHLCIRGVCTHTFMLLPLLTRAQAHPTRWWQGENQGSKLDTEAPGPHLGRGSHPCSALRTGSRHPGIRCWEWG